MHGGANELADEGVDLLVGADIGGGRDRPGDQAGGRLGLEEGAGEADHPAEALPVGRLLQQVELDLRPVARVRRAERHLAPALGPQQHIGRREDVADALAPAWEPRLGGHRHRGDQELHVGPFELRPGAVEALGRDRQAGDLAGSEQPPLQHRQHQPVEPQLGIEADLALGVPHGPEGGVVLQVLADAGQVVQRLDPHSGQLVGRPHAREQQQLGRVEGPAAEDHLARGHGPPDFAVLPVLDADRPALLDQHPVAQRPDFHREIRPAEHRLQEPGRGRAPPALVHGELGGGETFRLGGVEVFEALEAERLGGLQQLGGDELVGIVPRDGQFALAPVIQALAPPVRLALLEVGQHLRVAPPREAELAPVVVVHGVAAGIHHPVHRRGAAQHLAAGGRNLAAVEIGLRLGHQAPADLRVHEGVAPGQRHGHQRAVVGAPRLQQQHAVLRIGRETIGQDAAGRSSAHDDEVEFAHAPPT